METMFGAYYTSDDLGGRTLPDNTEYLSERNIWRADSDFAVRLGREFRDRFDAGETLYLLGFLGTAHDSGIALVEASRRKGIEVIANCEEERFRAVKHYAGYPALGVEEIRRLLVERGAPAPQVFGVFYAFDVVHEEQLALRTLLANGKIAKGYHFRNYLDAVKPVVDLHEKPPPPPRKNLFSHSPSLAGAFERLRGDLGLPASIPCIQMLHHENHAYAAFALSPFARDAHRNNPTMIACLDGGGDLSSISLFMAGSAGIELVRRNQRINSLETFYMLCAIALGGWTALNADGDSRSDNRFMAAAALGNQDRLTNPFYKRLRQYFHFAAHGEFFVNTLMAEGSMAGLERIVGPFYLESGDRSAAARPQPRALEITQRRLDVAAAVQLVFEDALFHTIGALIDETGSDQLVLCGQAATNDVANLRLLEHFNRDYYTRSVKRDARLHLWVPPVAADQGAVVGAAFQFAMRNGATPAETTASAYCCGTAATGADVERAISQLEFVHALRVGQADRDLADWMAYVVAQDAVVGIFQGAAENGGRALGHRSILFNPRNPDAQAILNARVKRRESIRPLSPMVTLEEAARWFVLSDGAAASDFDAYRYMVIAARATEAARRIMPGIVDVNGMSRLQIVRPHDDALIHAYLKALKAHIGAELSVNTSLNVATPIVQTPSQALAIFSQDIQLDCIFLVGREGEAFMAWPDASTGRVSRFDFPALRRSYLKVRERPAEFPSWFDDGARDGGAGPAMSRINVAIQPEANR